MEASYATIMYMGNKQVGSTRQQASSWPAAIRNITKTIDCRTSTDQTTIKKET